MALNPVAYTEKIVRGFLKYQLTAYPFSDPTLYAQMRELLSLEHTRETPLLKGPYVSLSRAFRPGASFKTLAGEGLAHPLLETLHPYPTLYSHQEKAFRSIGAGKTTLVSTGTGSGKTEAFLYPILSRCLKLRDENAEPGIVAVLVYPMNALAEDQLQRLRGLLTGTGITFGMYVGKTPERSDQVTGTRLTAGASQATYQAALKKAQDEKRNVVIHPLEERPSRQELRENPPRILLTNVKQLELLLTRTTDVELFTNARLEYLVFDEAHTYSGAVGAETACLIRRLRTFCGRSADETTCVATSATIADPERGIEAGRDFAARFFGVERESVTLIGEEYESDVWSPHRQIPLAPPGDSNDHLQAVLAAVDTPNAAQAVPAAYQAMTGTILSSDGWEEALHADLSRNQIVYQLADILKKPLSLEDLVDGLRGRIGRRIPESEILAWLALGAAARQDARPLLRPVMHGFVRGVSGAVVTFPLVGESVRLHLSAEDALRNSGDEGSARLPILTCNTCGQHYFEHHAADFSFTKDMPGGGQLKGTQRYWQSQESSLGGKRLVLTNRLLATLDEDDEAEESDKLAEVFLCRVCGTLHETAFSSCASCGHDEPPVRLLAVAQNPAFPGKLARCVSCGSPGAPRGGNYREPARPVRAVAVADVHILAQEMIHHAERPRLLVFADNRQDAAFQAGWMRDHARRFRFRALMMERIQKSALSIGDLTAYLERYLDSDPELSEALIPEVWQVAKPTATGLEHANQRRRYLRIQILRELTTSLKDRRGLEPLGRLRIDYHQLTPEVPFIANWSTQLYLNPERLRDGIAALLDRFRRGFYLLDPETKVFSHFWLDGDFEIQRGYLPKLKGIPKGLKLEKGSNTEKHLTYWLGSSGDTVVRQAVRGWGVPKDDQEEFIRQLWQTLSTELKLLKPVTLAGAKGNALPNCPGAYQIDADQLLLAPSVGVWRCKKCRRAQVRPTPEDKCMAWRCDGTLAFEGENPDHYDLGMLDGGVRMLRPKEHSAQVPHKDREKIESQFKAETGEAINTLVCTPTLELGVDIGALDTVLMRNVPPLPANYWQRAGRAGRRHRMAVNLTYARTTSHDLAYFTEPLKMLEGRVEPPRFNLRNELMVAKHVHATVFTRLNQRLKDTTLTPNERAEMAEVIVTAIPKQVRLYLFEDSGRVREKPYDVAAFGTLLQTHRADLLNYITRTFEQGWPAEDADTVTAERLAACLDNMCAELQRVVATLHKRLHWCLGQMRRLDSQRAVQGTLKPDEDALFRRCDRLVKRLKGEARQARNQAQGYDDTNTFAALAAEGFLPGYGLEIGSILGTALLAQSSPGESDFELPRPNAMALREYVPGNLIYANGHRFVPRYFHLEAQDASLGFQVDPINQTVQEVGTVTQGGAATLTTTMFPALPICDVDLAHVSHIGDDEDFRFQLGVDVYGHERNRHEGGNAYQWGERTLHLRRGVHLRLVNVGPSSLVANGALGYPVCQVCGQSRSPFSSTTEQDHFKTDHETRCGRPIEHVGFYADLVADTLSLPECATREEAYSLAEALRIGASLVLEMDREDLDILVIGQPGSDQATALLFDPMPGGSGLLEQLTTRFAEVILAASTVAGSCPGSCERSCIDCFQTFRNAYFHKHLNRKLVCQKLEQWGRALTLSHAIPPKTPTIAPTGTELPVNTAEARLRLLLEKAGFPEADWHKQIQLGHPLGSTSPDCFYPDEDGGPGTCLYLDGLSKHIHGNKVTQEKDRNIREELDNRGYTVLRILATDLWDKEKMRLHFVKLGKVLVGKEQAKKTGEDTTWFED
ncbi:DEAD/DEAH box helicase [Armatimonas sp.]|uniref:DEAD/DEAH box helicase n=1 Tax=Armatimonas sp. TaxID=1872638 RepID=UPI0037529E6F